MKKNSWIQKICVMVGAVLVVIALAGLVFWQWNIRHSEKQANLYVQTLRALIPEPQNAVPEEHRENLMPVLPVDGVDFLGILEFPQYGSELPVCWDWGKSTQYPCRFGGSIYDGSLQIGATTQKGQYPFYREILVGDTVLFTDVEGNCYSYAVSAMRYEKHVDQAALEQETSDLTVFVKNIYSFDYLIIFCNVS